MNSDIFEIKEIDPVWDRLTCSVTWPNKGVVRNHRYTLLKLAAETGDWRIGVTNGGECHSIDTVILYSQAWAPEMLDHLFGRSKELRGLAFTQRKYAEDFVDRAEKYIAWKMLARMDHA